MVERRKWAKRMQSEAAFMAFMVEDVANRQQQYLLEYNDSSSSEVFSGMHERQQSQISSGKNRVQGYCLRTSNGSCARHLVLFGGYFIFIVWFYKLMFCL